MIATSALELGIDMPDLNYGVNLDLPPSRKQFHQRLGRVGRTQPGTFIILAPSSRFSAYGETLKDYYDNSVEPSHLYLDNEYVNYQQAVCLKEELERSGRDARIPPEGTSWPQGFEDALRNAHGRPPAHLRALQDRRSENAPQLAHSLRNSGDETLQILAKNETGGETNIGYINLPSAMDEAYPGAVYHHRGSSYRIEGMGPEPEEPAALHPGRPDGAPRRKDQAHPAPDGDAAPGPGVRNQTGGTYRAATSPR